MYDAVISSHLQYHRGRPADQPVWVFGMCDTSVTPALGYMQVVARRDAATLLPLIEDHVNQGTIIWSDSWAAYDGISQLPSVQGHSAVNHSIEFATTAGVHTNHIESYILEPGKDKTQKNARLP